MPPDPAGVYRRVQQPVKFYKILPLVRVLLLLLLLLLLLVLLLLLLLLLLLVLLLLPLFLQVRAPAR